MLSNLFKDKSGKVVLGQFPNAPLLGWIFFRVAGMVVESDSLKASFDLAGSLLLGIWALLELTSGVTRFRQILGAVVLLLVVAGFFV